jgi:hypothetical protein
VLDELNICAARQYGADHRLPQPGFSEALPEHSITEGRFLLRQPSRRSTVSRPFDSASTSIASRRVHGFDRGAEFTLTIEQGTARVVERGTRLTGYATNLGLYGHSTAETNVDMQSLIASAESFAGPGILVPSRNSTLLRRCLANHLRRRSRRSYAKTAPS